MEPLHLAGFRLAHFSVRNWGTFDQQIWQLAPEQQNSLLTGNIGSGKSTLVDGLTTLLVPPRKLAFNKAAGAEEKERSVASYFHGYYTSQQDEYGKARSVGLRNDKHYSVLLARFYSEGLQQTVSLAQVFWMKPGDNKIKRLFVVATNTLSIEEDFSGFGTQISQLKKQLRKQQGVEMFDSFSAYAQQFSKLLGLSPDGKALELFNQTISMKSVGSVTDFVRNNMLQQPDVEAQLQQLEQNYDDLKRLHDAVVAAREKVELLTPVDQYGQQVLSTGEEKQHMEQSREMLDAFMAEKAIVLYEARIHKRQQELDTLQQKLQQYAQQKQTLDEGISQLNEDIRNNGGGRLAQIQKDIRQLSENRDQSKKLFDIYQNLVNTLSLNPNLDESVFVTNIDAAKNRIENIQQQLEELEQQQFAVQQQQEKCNEQQQNVQQEIDGLRQRSSNIHWNQLQIREHLCKALDVDEQRLPFVGELLQVKRAQSKWQGAIERVLHNFALSLLVPDDLYRQVCDFVEQTHLGTRLVYYRVKQPQFAISERRAPDSLLSKIDIKPDSEHYQWLEHELQRRFDYACCEQLDDFRRSEKAITPNGQIKAGKSRHEKDDRHNINDKSRYVLGWNNKDKISLLNSRLEGLRNEAKQFKQQFQQIKVQKTLEQNLSGDAKNLANFTWHYSDINWSRFARQIEQLQQEQQQLEQSSDVLRNLQQQLAKQQLLLSEVEEQTREGDRQQGQLENDLGNLQQQLSEQRELQSQAHAESKDACFSTLEDMFNKYMNTTLRINMLANTTCSLRVKLNEKIQHLEEKRRKKQGQMVAAMGEFARAFPNDVAELDASLEALGEYQQLLKQLVEQDLPRHEARFKDMLNRDTIRAMALFRSYLESQQEEIEARISLINQSLHELDYQQGTYIEIDGIGSSDVEVRDFKQRLKNCVEFSTDDSLYSEEKFQRVKDLIEQMRNEPKWTLKVVDVRYWYLFNVVERYREDNSEKECYSDSGGKSGGQKEKLAYSILAAAILLQYGLVDQDRHISAKAKRRFNLVVIDEAFARGSKDSTRFGLELFKKLGLQLLLVTPMQKLDVIEHYVKHVQFVDQKNNRSMLLNMTIEEYRHKLQQHKSLQPYRNLVEPVQEV
jgi:uncharacterized protein YPO0396